MVRSFWDMLNLNVPWNTDDIDLAMDIDMDIVIVQWDLWLKLGDKPSLGIEM